MSFTIAMYVQQLGILLCEMFTWMFVCRFMLLGIGNLRIYLREISHHILLLRLSGNILTLLIDDFLSHV